jgi:DNA modification methylase
MARKKRTAQQPSLFKREIPQMPEGYYSSGPNPNLRRFVEEHATPYDPETDDYNIPPFDKSITTARSTAIYNMHTYWSKKPPDAIRQYIRHYTQPGDIMLDPLCGSGTTSLAALMEGRSAIAIDISPAATFITKNHCTPVDVDKLQQAFDELQAKVKPEMGWLYETRCDRCDGRATTVHTVYSYVFQCSRCLEKVPLFDCVDAVGQTAKGKPKKIRACPYCYSQEHVEDISTTRNERFDPVPVLVTYLCEEGCKPKRGERRHNDPDPKKRAFFEKYDLGKLCDIEAKEIPYWYPPHRMMNVESDTDPWGDKWRAGTSNFRTVAELFTKRNLWALAALLDAIRGMSTGIYRDTLMFGFTSILLKASQMMAHNRDGIGRIQKGTYYIPQIEHDINVWRFMAEAVSDLKAGFKDIIVAIPNLIISTSDARELDIQSDTIDYIFTDPPYAGNVQYGELNFVWEAWLDFDTAWHDSEIIVNRTRAKTEADWERMMRQAMSEGYRVLKPGLWISLCYHDTSEGTWHLVQDMMTEVGFIPEQLETTLYIDTPAKTTNQYFAEKVTRRDLVINFRKPRPGEFAQLILFGDEDPATFAEKARAVLHEALEAHPGSPADRLYDELVSRMVRKGEFERHNFDELLHSVAEEVDGRWYLLETADQVDEAESAKEAAAAAHLEAFMQTYLAEHLEESGVHYSDLFEQYLPVQDKPRRLMQDWLPEYFFRTPEGTWRPPSNEEERAQKETLRTSGTLRRIKRFARALLEGVPPHDRDRPANTATAADWVRQCRRAGLYELGRALYEKGGFNFQELSDEGQLEVEEDYQVCVRRS